MCTYWGVSTYHIRQNFRVGKLSRLCTKYTINWKTFVVHQAVAIMYCTQQVIKGCDRLKNHENRERFPIRKFCRIQYLCTYIQMYIILYACICTYIHTCIYACTHRYVLAYIHVYCTYVHACIHTYVHTYIRAGMHLYCTYIHTYVHIHMSMQAEHEIRLKSCVSIRYKICSNSIRLWFKWMSDHRYKNYVTGIGNGVARPHLR